MATLVKCYKCKSQVEIKTTTLCSVCGHRYEFNCAGLSEKLYNIMDQSSKRKWKCLVCVQKQRDNQINLQKNTSPSNVTTRKQKAMQSKVLDVIPVSPSPLLRKSKSTEEINNTSLISSPEEQNEHSKQIIELKKNIINLQNKLLEAKEEIIKLNKIIKKLSNNLKIQETNDTEQKELKIEKTKQFKLSTNRKRKLCLISNNNRLKITQMMQVDDFYSQFDLCHYIYTGCGIDVLLGDIENKTKHFTKDDYCVIMIGETDIYYSQKVEMLVENIRKKLLQITNTNIIIAAPTYICGKIIYNYRIESFNNQLYEKCIDLSNVYVFDSNKELDFNMFSKITGKINRKGIKCNLNSLAELTINIQEDCQDNQSVISYETENHFVGNIASNSQFFLS